MRRWRSLSGTHTLDGVRPLYDLIVDGGIARDAASDEIMQWQSARTVRACRTARIRLASEQSSCAACLMQLPGDSVAAHIHFPQRHRNVT